MGYDDFDDDDLDGYTGDDLVKRLRNQLKAAQKTLREQASVIEELSSVTHEQSVAGMLADYGLNPNIARYIPDDVQSEDDLNEWLDEFGADFGIEPVDDNGVEYDDNPDAQMYERMAAVEEDGGYDPYAGYDLNSKIESAGNADELLAMLRGTAQ